MKLLPSGPLALIIRGLLLAAACQGVRLRAAPDDGWSFDLAPYLWVASAQVDSSLPNLPPSTPPDEPHFKSKITGALMIGGEIRRGNFGLFAYYDWLRMNTESAHPGPAFSAVELRSDISEFTIGLTYHLQTNPDWDVAFFAGARLWNVSEDFDFKAGVLPGFSRSEDRSWTDPTLGITVRYAISPQWFLTGKFYGGGFGGSGSTEMLDMVGGVGYQITPRSSVLFGYRYLREDFKREAFTWNLSASGVLLAYAFRF